MYLVDGQVDGAIDFDGVNDYVDVGSNYSLDFTTEPITVEAWINTNEVTKTENPIFYHADGSSGNMMWGVEISDKKLRITAAPVWNSWTQYTSTVNGIILNDQWYHVAYVIDLPNQEVTFYINGNKLGDTVNLSHNYIVNYAGVPSDIGNKRRAATGYPKFNGLIDEVCISNSARSPAWIKASYYSRRDDLISFGSAESIDDIDPSSIQTFTFTWNTGQTLSGNYLVRAKLYEDGISLTEDTANFTILPEKTVTSKVTTDKIQYNPNQTITITSTIRSESPNYILENLNATITITDSTATELYTETNTIPILTPDQLTELKTYWNTSQNPKGTYTVTLETIESTTTLSTSTTTFQILGTSATGEGITGTITASPDPVYQGKQETLTYTITNNGNEDIDNLNIKVLIIDSDTQEIKTEFSSQYSVNSGETITEIRTVSTANLTPETYLAILQASTSSMLEPKTLASTTFQIKPGIEITKTIPDTKNILVWLNYPWESGQDYPDRSQIEDALNNAGVSYHIALDKKDFQTELRNPYYTDFLILGDHYPLEDDFSEELREQVYSGKGLISSMFNRQNLDKEVFGIKFTGHLSGRDYIIELPESEISTAEDFQSYGKALKIEALNPEENIGWIIETSKKGIKKYPGIIRHNYSLGKVLFFAFDLGLSSQNYSRFKALLKNSLNYIHNPLDTTAYHPNQLIPVEIKSKSLGAAFDLRITETYPAEIKLYDPSTSLRTVPITGQWITQNPWQTELHLEPDETKSILYYVLTPDKTGTYTLLTEVEYLEEGDYKPYQSLSTDIVIDRDITTVISDIIVELNALSVSAEDREKLDNAIRYIENVQNRAITSELDIDKNIHDILKSIESLLSITSADISTVRLMIDELLRIWEGRYYLYKT